MLLSGAPIGDGPIKKRVVGQFDIRSDDQVAPGLSGAPVFQEI
jgi:hypothetical protein